MNKAILKRKLLEEGKTYVTNNFGEVVVEKYESSDKVHVRFKNTGSTTVTCMSTLRSGSLKDKQAPSILGFGIVGEDVPSKGGIQDKAYGAWHSILTRCLSPRVKAIRPTYADCKVHEDWQYYQNFKEWFYNQVGYDSEGYQVDKDLLVRGNLLYSADTCCLIPRDLNVFLARLPVYGCTTRINFKVNICKYSVVVWYEGCEYELGYFKTYKQAFLELKTFKEQKLKEFAEKYKGLVSDRVYERLMTYEIYCEWY